MLTRPVSLDRHASGKVENFSSKPDGIARVGCHWCPVYYITRHSCRADENMTEQQDAQCLRLRGSHLTVVLSQQNLHAAITHVSPYFLHQISKKFSIWVNFGSLHQFLIVSQFIEAKKLKRSSKVFYRVYLLRSLSSLGISEDYREISLELSEFNPLIVFVTAEQTISHSLQFFIYYFQPKLSVLDPNTSLTKPRELANARLVLLATVRQYTTCTVASVDKCQRRVVATVSCSPLRFNDSHEPASISVCFTSETCFNVCNQSTYYPTQPRTAANSIFTCYLSHVTGFQVSSRHDQSCLPATFANSAPYNRRVMTKEVLKEA